MAQFIHHKQLDISSFQDDHSEINSLVRNFNHFQFLHKNNTVKN